MLLLLESYIPLARFFLVFAFCAPGKTAAGRAVSTHYTEKHNSPPESADGRRARNHGARQQRLQIPKIRGLDPTAARRNAKMNGSALAVGDRARFRLPDKSVHRGVVTAANDDGTYSLEEEGTGVVHRLPGAKVKRDDAGAATTPTVVRLITQDENELGEDGEALLRVEEEGLQLLESLNETRVAVCSVAGMYRTGKSFFLESTGRK